MYRRRRSKAIPSVKLASAEIIEQLFDILVSLYFFFCRVPKGSSESHFVFSAWLQNRTVRRESEHEKEMENDDYLGVELRIDLEKLLVSIQQTFQFVALYIRRILR